METKDRVINVLGNKPRSDFGKGWSHRPAALCLNTTDHLYAPAPSSIAGGNPTFYVRAAPMAKKPKKQGWSRNCASQLCWARLDPLRWFYLCHPSRYRCGAVDTEWRTPTSPSILSPGQGRSASSLPPRQHHTSPRTCSTECAT